MLLLQNQFLPKDEQLTKMALTRKNNNEMFSKMVGNRGGSNNRARLSNRL